MSVTIRELEKAWLEAETMADEVKRAARQVDDQLRKSKSAKDGGEIKVLVSSLEELRAKQEMAERSANDAFDRLWQAKSNDGAGGATAYA